MPSMIISKDGAEDVYKRQVIINVKNSCNSYTKCGTFSSKDYGTGLYNVENSVKKYEGFLKISYSQTEFNCNVVLSNTH